MMLDDLTCRRRDFLRGAAALAAIAVTGCAGTSIGATSSGVDPLQLHVTESDGSPLDAQRLRTLHARDLHNDPLPRAISSSQAKPTIELDPAEPIQISLRLKVPGFGEVYCYADAGGQGYRRPGMIDFVVEAAKTRLRRVRQALEVDRGVSVDRAFHDHLAAAGRPIPDATGPQRTSGAYEALAHGLHAGEMLALARARDRIRRFGRRSDFRFGILASGAGQHGAGYDKLLRELFNFATTSWYIWRDEASAATDPVDYSRMDQSIDWCLANGIAPKGFGYLYMVHGAVPAWLRSGQWSYEQIKALYARAIGSTMARYDGRLACAEIMNEAHDKANLWRLNHEQILDMAKMAFAAARQGSATIKRQMNHCCLWAEYAKHRNHDGSQRWSPWQFVKACFGHGIDYEVIGLQLYYPQNDLFEIDRMLDRFIVFGKDLHITEMAAASADGLDPHSMRPHTYAPGWHGPWTPDMQADWVEGIYTLCYSKPAFKEVGWWDFSDATGHFWPFGGLLDDKFQPKPAYIRLKQLQRQWGIGPASTQP